MTSCLPSLLIGGEFGEDVRVPKVGSKSEPNRGEEEQIPGQKSPRHGEGIRKIRWMLTAPTTAAHSPPG